MRTDDKKHFVIEYYPDYTLVKVTEDKLDSVIAPLLKIKFQELVSINAKNIILDISRCQYCDSSGLTVFLVGNRTCKLKGGVFLLVNVSDAIDRLLKISQLITLVKVCKNVEEAVGIIDPSLKIHETYY